MTDPDSPGDPQPQGERDDRPELDVDSAFAAIVAGFSTPVPHGVGPWPASEDLDDEDADTVEVTEGGADTPPDGGPAAESGPDRPGPPGVPGVDRWDPPMRRIALPGDDLTLPVDPGPGPEDVLDEGYQPPDPPPIRGDLVSRLAWGAVLGGPAFLLAAALVWRSLPTILLLLALVAFVGGFVTLVARMPPDHPEDPDDGAVV